MNEQILNEHNEDTFEEKFDEENLKFLKYKNASTSIPVKKHTKQ
jgi:hypothetical protein